ncbi:hypothetical protein ADUPG1_008929 [Aduncisulcus paluster]|uniref:Uncharacterized protein n=1 Tax=Aduncisulcus paluster TaxID=2918883 RepID=A0ABQ5KWL8_9EUKA|nr:hypothetical protein ADUPG1_008929 [Aduncisulcus paluster]
MKRGIMFYIADPSASAHFRLPVSIRGVSILSTLIMFWKGLEKELMSIIVDLLSIPCVLSSLHTDMDYMGQTPLTIAILCHYFYVSKLLAWCGVPVTGIFCDSENSFGLNDFPFFSVADCIRAAFIGCNLTSFYNIIAFVESGGCNPKDIVALRSAGLLFRQLKFYEYLYQNCVGHSPTQIEMRESCAFVPKDQKAPMSPLNVTWHDQNEVFLALIINEVNIISWLGAIHKDMSLLPPVQEESLHDIISEEEEEESKGDIGDKKEKIDGFRQIAENMIRCDLSDSFKEDVGFHDSTSSISDSKSAHTEVLSMVESSSDLVRLSRGVSTFSSAQISSIYKDALYSGSKQCSVIPHSISCVFGEAAASMIIFGVEDSSILSPITMSGMDRKHMGHLDPARIAFQAEISKAQGTKFDYLLVNVIYSSVDYILMNHPTDGQKKYLNRREYSGSLELTARQALIKTKLLRRSQSASLISARKHFENSKTAKLAAARGVLFRSAKPSFLVKDIEKQLDVKLKGDDYELSKKRHLIRMIELKRKQQRSESLSTPVGYSKTEKSMYIKQAKYNPMDVMERRLKRKKLLSKLRCGTATAALLQRFSSSKSHDSVKLSAISDYHLSILYDGFRKQSIKRLLSQRAESAVQQSGSSSCEPSTEDFDKLDPFEIDCMLEEDNITEYSLSIPQLQKLLESTLSLSEVAAFEFVSLLFPPHVSVVTWNTFLKHIESAQSEVNINENEGAYRLERRYALEEAGESVRMFPYNPYWQHRSNVEFLCFLPTISLIVSCAKDGLLQFWNMHGKCVRTLLHPRIDPTAPILPEDSSIPPEFIDTGIGKDEDGLVGGGGGGCVINGFGGENIGYLYYGSYLADIEKLETPVPSLRAPPSVFAPNGCFLLKNTREPLPMTTNPFVFSKESPTNQPHLPSYSKSPQQMKKNVAFGGCFDHLRQFDPQDTCKLPSRPKSASIRAKRSASAQVMSRSTPRRRPQSAKSRSQSSHKFRFANTIRKQHVPSSKVESHSHSVHSMYTRKPDISKGTVGAPLPSPSLVVSSIRAGKQYGAWCVGISIDTPSGLMLILSASGDMLFYSLRHNFKLIRRIKLRKSVVCCAMFTRRRPPKPEVSKDEELLRIRGLFRELAPIHAPFIKKKREDPKASLVFPEHPSSDSTIAHLSVSALNRNIIPMSVVNEYNASQRVVVVGCMDGSLIFFDLFDLTPIKIVRNVHDPAITKIKVFDGKGGVGLVSSGRDGCIFVWDKTTLSVNRRLKYHLNVTDIDFSYAQRLLFSAGSEGRIAVWNSVLDKPIAIGDEHKSKVIGIHVCDSMRCVMSVSEDKQIIQWNSVTLIPIAIMVDKTKHSPYNQLTASAFDMYSKILLIAGSCIRPYELKSIAEIREGDFIPDFGKTKNKKRKDKCSDEDIDEQHGSDAILTDTNPLSPLIISLHPSRPVHLMAVDDVSDLYDVSVKYVESESSLAHVTEAVHDEVSVAKKIKEGMRIIVGEDDEDSEEAQPEESLVGVSQKKAKMNELKKTMRERSRKMTASEKEEDPKKRWKEMLDDDCESIEFDEKSRNKILLHNYSIKLEIPKKEFLSKQAQKRVDIDTKDSYLNGVLSEIKVPFSPSLTSKKNKIETKMERPDNSRLAPYSGLDIFHPPRPGKKLEKADLEGVVKTIENQPLHDKIASVIDVKTKNLDKKPLEQLRSLVSPAFQDSLSILPNCVQILFTHTDVFRIAKCVDIPGISNKVTSGSVCQIIPTKNNLVVIGKDGEVVSFLHDLSGENIRFQTRKLLSEVDPRLRLENSLQMSSPLPTDFIQQTKDLAIQAACCDREGRNVFIVDNIGILSSHTIVSAQVEWKINISKMISLRKNSEIPTPSVVAEKSSVIDMQYSQCTGSIPSFKWDESNNVLEKNVLSLSITASLPMPLTLSLCERPLVLLNPHNPSHFHAVFSDKQQQDVFACVYIQIRRGIVCMCAEDGGIVKLVDVRGGRVETVLSKAIGSGMYEKEKEVMVGDKHLDLSLSRSCLTPRPPISPRPPVGMSSSLSRSFRNVTLRTSTVSEDRFGRKVVSRSPRSRVSDVQIIEKKQIVPIPPPIPSFTKLSDVTLDINGNVCGFLMTNGDPRIQIISLSAKVIFVPDVVSLQPFSERILDFVVTKDAEQLVVHSESNVIHVYDLRPMITHLAQILEKTSLGSLPPPKSEFSVISPLLTDRRLYFEGNITCMNVCPFVKEKEQNISRKKAWRMKDSHTKIVQPKEEPTPEPKTKGIRGILASMTKPKTKTETFTSSISHVYIGINQSVVVLDVSKVKLSPYVLLKKGGLMQLEPTQLESVIEEIQEKDIFVTTKHDLIMHAVSAVQRMRGAQGIKVGSILPVLPMGPHYKLDDVL